jgi:hypothetical protein
MRALAKGHRKVGLGLLGREPAWATRPETSSRAYPHRFRELCRKVIDEDADRRQQALHVRRQAR